MISFEELHKLSLPEVMRELRKANREMLKLRLQKANNELKETHKLQNYRKYLAHLKTKKRMLELESTSNSPINP